MKSSKVRYGHATEGSVVTFLSVTNGVYEKDGEVTTDLVTACLYVIARCSFGRFFQHLTDAISDQK